MTEKILSLTDISVSYGNKTVLKDFSFSLPEGGKIIISGPNGSGKTTLLKCILGLVKINKGRIEKANNLNIAYFKQDFPGKPFPVSAFEVVSMGSPDRETVLEAMKETDSLNLADRAFFSLSGGEKQKVSLARCFAQKANLLLFDEPSSFLDSDSRKAFVNILKNLKENISAIVVTHDSSLTEELCWTNIKLKEENT